METFILDVMEIEFLLSDFLQKLRPKGADIPGFYFTLLNAAGISPTLFINQNFKTKEGDARSLSTSEPQKLQDLYAQGCAVLWVSARFSES